MKRREKENAANVYELARLSKEDQVVFGGDLIEELLGRKGSGE